ncbi:MAG: glutamate-1-semialdehyde 2,1-aminomutase [Acidobacteria bacterium]|nr:glutamate-1-semialdehyde 2,1-aminomutase [Acidobacteriota bacterium]
MSGSAPPRSVETSRRLFERARRVIPGGVNSPVRAFRGVGGDPLFIIRARGSHVFDADGNDYIDYVGSWGPLILGHAHGRVVKALAQTAASGVSFGAPTPAEIELATLVCGAFPSVERVRMVNSGTEATMSALRLARAVTRRDAILKMEGCYHGHVDSLLVKAGSGVLTLGIPGSPGVSAAVAAETRTAPYNDLHALSAALAAHGNSIAAVILEPVAGNMGCVPPAPGYLAGVRELTAKHGVLLIFDEVMTGFRLAYGGAQERFGVASDLTTLGKIIGGGLPVGAYGGRADLMARIAPEGDVYQAGTLSGNPLAMRAGIETLEALREPGTYARLETISAALEGGLAEAARNAGVPVTINRVGSMMTVFFTDGPVTDHATAVRSDTRRYAAFFHAMLDRGVYFPPAQFEAFFVSLAHTDTDVEATIAAAGEAFAKLRSA